MLEEGLARVTDHFVNQTTMPALQNILPCKYLKLLRVTRKRKGYLGTWVLNCAEEMNCVNWFNCVTKIV